MAPACPPRVAFSHRRRRSCPRTSKQDLGMLYELRSRGMNTSICILADCSSEKVRSLRLQVPPALWPKMTRLSLRVPGQE